MWERVIVHADLNHCYAQIEEMMYPELRQVPMAVGGDEQSRHGIILAKNDLAYEYGIKTGESLREAYRKCPDLLIIEPHYDDYLYYTEEVKNIYREYSDKVENFGLDEAWIDLTASQGLFGGNPVEIVREIQERIYKELGLAVSMGVSFNKVFAKLGSDFNKKMGLTVISQKNYKNVVFPLPVDELFYVGKATAAKLKEKSIYTIGDIAYSRQEYLKSFLGKHGEMIWRFANGLDVSDVTLLEYENRPKSIGNGVTAPHDLSTFEEAKNVLRVLVESVASRLKERELRGSVITIGMRDHELHSFTRQRKIDVATNISSEIMQTVELLLKENCMSQYSGYLDRPYRSMSVKVSQLEEDIPQVQLSLFTDESQRQKEKKLDLVIDEIRKRFGYEKIKRCCLNIHQELTSFNPKEEHIIHPESWFKSS
ncbi:DNA polymerase IV [Candidatus Stoquefichus massiliensis]|uniref:Y-family DNA polymerase n=1 Tax=Candidatus Stoquefichus massiliensis TaxID=1470350 RepID=UPI000488500F|nr:DNA polymerase IV [Candidatus Stoquefichus massiliensis]